MDKVSYKLPITVGVLILVVAAAGAAALYQITGPVEEQDIGFLYRFAAFWAVVGIAAIGLGIYIRHTLKKKVFYKLAWKDYGFLVLQVAPGFALSWLGNTLTPEFSWLSLGLGTALSVLFLRKTGPK